MIDVFWLILSGLVSGIVGGMGMGGGTLLIPILTLMLGYEQKSSQGINLLVFVPMSIVALIIHIKNKLVDFGVGVPIMIAGVVCSVAGALLANSLNDKILRKLFGGFLLLVGVYQGVVTIINILKSKKTNDIKPKFKFRIYFK